MFSWVKAKLALLNVEVEDAWKAKEHVRVASEFLVSLKVRCPLRPDISERRSSSRGMWLSANGLSQAGHMFGYIEDGTLMLGQTVPVQYTEVRLTSPRKGFGFVAPEPGSSKIGS